MAAPNEICAYCAKPVLTGEEKAEHPIPAALGASLEIDTVCDPCNEKAGVEIDQPFLGEAWLNETRARSGIIDPRRGKKGRAARSKLLEGATEDGDYVYLNKNGVPRLRPRIIDLGEGKFQIRANDEAEAERLRQRVEKRKGGSAELEETNVFSTNPKIKGEQRFEPLRWRRMAAKIGLGVGSLVFPESWRTGADASLLREWMRGEDTSQKDGKAPSLFPNSIEGTPIELMVSPPQHLLFFQQVEGTTYLIVVLFGTDQFWVPLDGSGLLLPRVAWLLDPDRPKRNGEIAFETLLAEIAVKIVEEGETTGDC